MPVESLVDLLPLLFIGLYYLLAGRRKAKAQKAARQHVEAPQTELISDESQSATPFQAFLEQLEEAMAESAGAIDQAEEPSPQLPSPRPREAGPRLRDAEFTPVSGSFDGPTAVDHERHGFGDENPLSEEVFEQRPVFSTTRHVPTADYDPHGLAERSTKRKRGVDWHARLRDPSAARDAFVLQTIFGARGGGGVREKARQRKW